MARPAIKVRDADKKRRLTAIKVRDADKKRRLTAIKVRDADKKRRLTAIKVRDADKKWRLADKKWRLADVNVRDTDQKWRARPLRSVTRYIAANTHPDHDTIATFRQRFLKQLERCFCRSCYWPRRWVY